jgi:outer membrane protein assembly factor BamB
VDVEGRQPGYASPMVIEISGVRHVVAMTNGSIVGLDAATGRELWTSPFPDEWHENIVTPVWTGSALIVSGTRQGTHAYRIARDGESWKASEIWKNADVTMYMSSPVHGDGLLYGLSVKRRGQYVALDAATGAMKWATEGREGEHASSCCAAPRGVLSNRVMSAVRRGAGVCRRKPRQSRCQRRTWACRFSPAATSSSAGGGVSRFTGQRASDSKASRAAERGWRGPREAERVAGAKPRTV